MTWMRYVWVNIGIVAIMATGCVSKEANLKCPDGTTEFGGAPPVGNRKYCGYKNSAVVGGVSKHGPWRFWWPNGQLESDGKYAKNKKHGLFTGWYSNGVKVRQGTYRNNDKVGIWKTWRRDGTLKSKIQYKQGLIHGFRRLYDEEGQMKLELWYRDGKKSAPH